MKRAVIALAIFAAAAPALADTPPEPARAVDREFFSGRWYEIARTDNPRQAGCQAPTYQFDPNPEVTRARFTLTCRKGAPDGPAEALNVTIRIPEDGKRNKFRVTALAGLVGVDYWVLDIAEDTSWAILATQDGEHVWLLARRPDLDSGLKQRLVSRMAAMGYDRGRFILPAHR